MQADHHADASALVERVLNTGGAGDGHPIQPHYGLVIDAVVCGSNLSAMLHRRLSDREAGVGGRH